MPKKVVTQKIDNKRFMKKNISPLQEKPVTAGKINSPIPNIFTTKKPVAKKPKNLSTKTNFDVNKILVENFIGLQKVLINMAEKIDNLSNRMSELLNLFEASAKSLAEKGPPQSGGGIVDKRLLEKVDNIMEQNRTIARGISLLHEPQQFAGSPPQQFQKKPSYEVQKIPASNKPEQENQEGLNQYQKSISSKPQRFNPLQTK